MYCTLSVLTHKHSPPPPFWWLKAVFQAFLYAGKSCREETQVFKFCRSLCSDVQAEVWEYGEFTGLAPPTGNWQHYVTPGNAVVSVATELHPTTTALFVQPFLQSLRLPVKHRCGCRMHALCTVSFQHASWKGMKSVFLSGPPGNDTTLQTTHQPSSTAIQIEVAVCVMIGLFI